MKGIVNVVVDVIHLSPCLRLLSKPATVLCFCNIICKIVVEHTAWVQVTSLYFHRISNTVASSIWWWRVWTRTESYLSAAPASHRAGTPVSPVWPATVNDSCVSEKSVRKRKERARIKIKCFFVEKEQSRRRYIKQKLTNIVLTRIPTCK